MSTIACMTRHGAFEYNKAVRYNTPGHAHFYTFSCFKRMPLLTNDLWRDWLAKSIRYACAKLEYSLWAYVFMPEHVHLLIKPRREKYNISEFMQLVKNPVARRILNSLRKSKSPMLTKLQSERRNGRVEYSFWQPGGGHDFNVWTIKKAVEKAEYCHNNPVKRRLVKSPDQWRWSSFRWLIKGSRENEPLALDPCDERIVGAAEQSAVVPPIAPRC